MGVLPACVSAHFVHAVLEEHIRYPESRVTDGGDHHVDAENQTYVLYKNSLCS